MEIKPLTHCSVSELTRAFNEAFSDYIVKFVMSEDMMQQRLKRFNMDLSVSPGVFDRGILRGFIFHGVDKRNGAQLVWNGGTGVAPAYRGKGLTMQLYNYITPDLKERGFQKTSLEVIVGNDSAIHVYKKAGFSILRDFDCYKGDILSKSSPENMQFRPINSIDWNQLKAFWDWEPSYQNNDQSIACGIDDMNLLGAYDKERLAGYIIFDKNPEAGDIYQFAVAEKDRRKGIGTALFAQVQSKKTVPLKLVNVDASDGVSSAFLRSIGFEKTISQHEMSKSL